MAYKHLHPGLALHFFFVFLVFLLGCQNGPSPESESREISAPAVVKQVSANFVVCIDNSRSIKPPEQIIIRETTMLLADLAEKGDRISVVTFGQDATVAASTLIANDQDRIYFKKQVLHGVTFTENFSDIRAGLRLLAEAPDSPLRKTADDDAVSYLIILSDGKLEPADKQAKQAFDQMKGLLEGPLAAFPRFAVVLGDTFCNHEIPQIATTGLAIMRDRVATGRDYFYHAKSFEQLFEIAVKILGKAKGITSLGEEMHSGRFKIDDSVESMTLIVRKKSSDGSSLYDSSDIILTQPPSTAENRTGSIYRNSDYQFFDLLVIRDPAEGLWSVTLQDGSQPEVLSKIDTPLELRINSRDTYYLNESSEIWAWMVNKNTSEIIDDQFYKIHAHLAKNGDLAASNVFLPFHLGSERGQYYLEVPEELKTAPGVGNEPATVDVEIIAQRQAAQAGDKLDPWFVRRSGPLAITLATPFAAWELVKPEVTKKPLLDVELNFGAALDPDRPGYPQFETLPTVVHVIERYNQESKSFQAWAKETLVGQAQKEKVAYQSRNIIGEAGTYRYRYQLDGIKRGGGSFSLKSPWYTVRIIPCATCWLILMALATVGILFCFFMIINYRGKIIGKIQINFFEDGALTRTVTKKMRTKRFENDEKDNRFVLKIKRNFFGKPAVFIEILEGEVCLNNKQLSHGQEQEISLIKRNHVVTDGNGSRREYEVKLEKISR